eukprot:7060885-Alexandrium_andersonii.AAC.1
MQVAFRPGREIVPAPAPECRGRLAARQGLAIWADWPLNRADLTDQPEVRAGRGRRGRLTARRSTS